MATICLGISAGHSHFALRNCMTERTSHLIGLWISAAILNMSHSNKASVAVITIKNFSLGLQMMYLSFLDTPCIYLQLTGSSHGIYEINKQQDKCTNFGWNPIGETSICLKDFSGKIWIYISQCSTEFLVSVCKVATFW